MVEFIRNHWEVIFGGIGTAIIVFLLGLFGRRKSSGKPEQSANAGTNSQIVQAGRDVTSTNLKKK
jgi:hypothetical protein